MVSSRYGKLMVERLWGRAQGELSPKCKMLYDDQRFCRVSLHQDRALKSPPPPAAHRHGDSAWPNPASGSAYGDEKRQKSPDKAGSPPRESTPPRPDHGHAPPSLPAARFAKRF